jgi:hypothetical protein
MKQYVGLDVSQKETAVCVVDQDGVTTRKCSECTTSGTLSELRAATACPVPCRSQGPSDRRR